MNKVKPIKTKYSGDSTEATRKEASRARNKAYICRFFDVKQNTPDNVLKEAINRYTGEKMSFSEFRFRQQNKT